MSALNPSVGAALAPGVGASTANYLTAAGGWKSWFLTLDHKRIGVMYMIGIACMFALGGTFALLVRTLLLWHTKDPAWASGPDWYNRFFTLHGAIMVFAVIIPGIPAGLGNFVLPIMIGAKDVAFPRLNLLSFYLWMGGTGMMLVSLVFGAIDTGWTFYTPYSTSAKSMGGAIPALIGVFTLGFSSIFTGLNFIVTIHKLRRPEMSWYKMPLFLWATYATAVIQVLATPVIGITVLLLIIERAVGIGIFDPALGGDPVLYQHFFWFYSHPAVYIMILPAMGVMSELISVFSHKHIFGYKFIAFSSVAIAIFGFLVWGHHMFVSGQSTLVSVIFSGLTFSVAVPSAIKVFNWLATMYKGSISLQTPMLYALSFVWIFGWGGLTGLHLGTLATDVHLHDTYFVVAHFHYVMAGTIFVFFGGLYYWWPKITGRMYPENLGRLSAILMFIGFNVTFMTQFFMGSHGMPRRYYNYPAEYQTYHRVSSVGSYIMAAGVITIAVSLARSLSSGKRAPDNPWGAGALEWQTTSPPPVENFNRIPYAGDPYDYESLRWDPKIEGYVRDDDGRPPAAPAH